MKTVELIPEEIEQHRAEQAAELAADSGKTWAEDNKPGSFGCHELLDRTTMLADQVEHLIQTHPACVANSEWYMLAHRAAMALHELYQRIGADRLGGEASNGAVE
jgi:hypothetical protein